MFGYPDMEALDPVSRQRCVFGYLAILHTHHHKTYSLLQELTLFLSGIHSIIKRERSDRIIQDITDRSYPSASNMAAAAVVSPSIYPNGPQPP